MRAFASFCKKEFTEHWRTYKLAVMLAAFLLFGIMSPLIAKLLPEIFNGSDMGGIPLALPEPSAMDSWAQFFKNIGQMGVLVLIIVFCGITANEFSKGTLINILTKGMKRRTVILSKFAVAVTIWTASYVLALTVTYAYTAYFWGNEALPHAFLAFAGPWVYELLLLSLLLLGGIWFKTLYGSLLLTGGAVAAMLLLNISPELQKYNPVSLGGDTLNLLNGQKTPADFIPALIVCSAAAIALVMGTIWMFNKKQV